MKNCFCTINISTKCNQSDGLISQIIIKSNKTTDNFFTIIFLLPFILYIYYYYIFNILFRITYFYIDFFGNCQSLKMYDNIEKRKNM